MNSGNAGQVTVVGAGGHAKVVISTLQAAGFKVVAVADDDPTKKGSALLGVVVRGTPSELLRPGGGPAVIAVGDNAGRRDVAARFPEIEWLVVVHPRAYVHSSVRVGPGTVVCAGAIVQPDTVLGGHVIVNTGATIDHDCSIGEFAHLGPGTHLSGGVRIGEGTLLGVGSAVKPGMTVGAWAIVGAGAAVVEDVPARTVAAGVPARTLKTPR